MKNFNKYRLSVIVVLSLLLTSCGIDSFLPEGKSGLNGEKVYLELAIGDNAFTLEEEFTCIIPSSRYTARFSFPIIPRRQYSDVNDTIDWVALYNLKTEEINAVLWGTRLSVIKKRSGTIVYQHVIPKFGEGFNIYAPSPIITLWPSGSFDLETFTRYIVRIEVPQRDRSMLPMDVRKPVLAIGIPTTPLL